MNSNFESKVIKFQLPANIKPGEEKYYSMILSGEIRSCSIKTLRNVQANRELILWKDGEMIEEAFAWPWIKKKLYGTFKKRLKFNIKRLLRRPIRINDPVLWCLDDYSTGGYFHWIVEILPRLWMARDYLPETYFAIPDYFLTRWPFCKEILTLLGVKKILVLNKYSQYSIKELLMPTRAGSPFYPQPIPLKKGVKWLKDCSLLASSKTLGERLYISRAKANYRKVENEQELYPVLKKYGFQIIYFEDYSLSDQISICKNAKVLMGLHGAGLANLAFLSPGGKIIEIRPDNVYHMYTCFFTLCQYFDCEYNYILCDYSPINHPTEKRIDDRSVIISKERLDENLMQILGIVDKAKSRIAKSSPTIKLESPHMNRLKKQENHCKIKLQRNYQNG